MTAALSTDHYELDRARRRRILQLTVTSDVLRRWLAEATAARDASVDDLIAAREELAAASANVEAISDRLYDTLRELELLDPVRVLEAVIRAASEDE